MSALYFAAVFHHGPRKPNERLVLMAMAEAADHDTGEVRMKAETVAQRAGVSQATAWRCIAALKAGDDPWIVGHEPGKRRNGSQGASEFRLNVERLRELVGERRRPVSQDETAPRAGVSTRETRCLKLRHLGSSQDETPSNHCLSTMGARANGSPRRSPPDGGGGALGDVAKLSPFQRAELRRGASVVVAGELVAARSEAMARWQTVLRDAERSCAEKGAAA